MAPKKKKKKIKYVFTNILNHDGGLRPAFIAFGLDKGRIKKEQKNGTMILTASPTAPSPNIATVEPGVTSATFQAAPIPASPSFQTLTPSITFPRFANGSSWGWNHVAY